MGLRLPDRLWRAAVLPDNDGADLLNSQDAVPRPGGLLMLPRRLLRRTAKERQRVQLGGLCRGLGGRWKHPEITSRVTRYAAATCHIVLTIPSALRRELLYAYALIGDDPFYDYREQHVYLNNGCRVFMYRGGYQSMPCACLPGHAAGDATITMKRFQGIPYSAGLISTMTGYSERRCPADKNIDYGKETNGERDAKNCQR